MSGIDWIFPTPTGLYCAAGDFYIDPMSPVDRAVVTHGHADHARAGHQKVLATTQTLAIMASRYGEEHARQTQAVNYGEQVTIGGAIVRLAPAGHVLGSAQVVIEKAGQRVVVSGDYKRRPDPTCTPFEVVPCDLFITEATFGLPVFRHPDAEEEVKKLLRSLLVFPEKTHLVGVYALGKCQRLIRILRDNGYDSPIFVHGALTALSDLYEQQGVALGELVPVTTESKKATKGRLVLCPPSALADRWSRGFSDRIAALASGWMLIRQRAKQRRVELPLVISDHADWDELTATITDVAADTIWVTHGQEEALVHYARSCGLEAAPLALQGRDEESAA